MNRKKLLKTVLLHNLFLLSAVILSIISIHFIFCRSSAFSETSGNKTTAQKEKNPNEVYTGIYLIRIPSMSMQDNQFTADFYLWLRWKGDNIEPYKTFEIVNGNIDDRKEQIVKVLPDGYKYASLRIQATITKYWDIHRFPFDNHILQLEFEDDTYSANELVYIPDSDNSGFNKDFKISGWTLGNPKISVRNYNYKSNWGDTSIPADKGTDYSRFTFSISLKREGPIHALRMLYGCYIAVLIGLVGLFIDYKDICARFSIPVGAIFTALASHFVVSTHLPASAQLTLIDKLYIASGVIILFIIIESVISLFFYEKKKFQTSRKMDMLSFFILLLLYIIANIIIIIPRSTA